MKKKEFLLQHQALNEKLKTGGNEVQINNNKNNAKKERTKKEKTALRLFILIENGWQAGNRTVDGLYRVKMCARSKRFNEMCEHLEYVLVCAERERVYARLLS